MFNLMYKQLVSAHVIFYQNCLEVPFNLLKIESENKVANQFLIKLVLFKFALLKEIIM